MTHYQGLLNHLDVLKLDKFKQHLDEYITLIRDEQKTVIEALYDLTALEIDFKREKAKHTNIKVAHFPFIKTLDDFDFTFQPSIHKATLYDLATLRFIEHQENIVFLGNSGVGKTHLATAIGIKAAEKRYSTYFISAHDLLTNLKKAHQENRLETRLKHYAKYKVLIIDEIGYLPITELEANIFFQLINMRYEKNHTIITTNKPFSEWTDVFGDPQVTAAILDRLLHHAQVIKITGRSYRTKDIVAEPKQVQNKDG